MSQTETLTATLSYGRIVSSFSPPHGAAPAFAHFKYQTPDVSGSFFEGTMRRIWITRISWDVEAVYKNGRWVVHPADRRAHLGALTDAHRDSLNRLREQVDLILSSSTGEL